MPIGVYHRTPEHRGILRLAMLGKNKYIRTDEHKKKISESRKGKALGRHSEESYLRMATKLKGRVKSKEHRKKISETLKRKYSNGEIVPPLLGRIFSLEHRQKLAEARCGKYSGENHPNWQGGITPENFKIRNSEGFQEWRMRVFVRDNWTCRECGKRSVKLHAHHIKSFAKHQELRFDLENGITLCKPCHKIITWGKCC